MSPNDDVPTPDENAPSNGQQNPFGGQRNPFGGEPTAPREQWPTNVPSGGYQGPHSPMPNPFEYVPDPRLGMGWGLLAALGVIVCTIAYQSLFGSSYGWLWEAVFMAFVPLLVLGVVFLCIPYTRRMAPGPFIVAAFYPVVWLGLCVTLLASY